MAASQLSVRRAYFAASALTTVDISTATLLGVLAEDSEIPEPENVTDGTMLGPAEVGATLTLNLRILGSGGAALTTLQTAKDANPPTDIYIYVPNRSGTAVTRYGPMIVSQAYALGDQTDPKRQSFRVRGTIMADTSESAVVRYAGTVVLPS